MGLFWPGQDTVGSERSWAIATNDRAAGAAGMILSPCGLGVGGPPTHRRCPAHHPHCRATHHPPTPYRRPSRIRVGSALQAGRLVASQPRISLANPLVAAVWGIGIFGEHVRTGGWLVGAAAGMGLIATGVVLLSRSSLLQRLQLHPS
jgi:hypothetical protein